MILRPSVTLLCDFVSVSHAICNSLSLDHQISTWNLHGKRKLIREAVGGEIKGKNGSVRPRYRAVPLSLSQSSVKQKGTRVGIMPWVIPDFARPFFHSNSTDY